MLIEHRAYTPRPGNVDAFYQAQVARGFALVQPIMERLIGYFTARSGPECQIVHLYRFDNYADWQTRLLGLYNVAALEPYFKIVRPLLIAQENTFLIPAPVAELTPRWGNGNDWLPAQGPLLARAPETIVEETTMVFMPGTLPAYWQACRDHGLAAGAFDAARLLGCFYTLVGRLHRVFEYRSFASFAAREAYHAAQRDNAKARQFAAALVPIVVTSESKLLAPAPVAAMTPLFQS